MVHRGASETLRSLVVAGNGFAARFATASPPDVSQRLRRPIHNGFAARCEAGLSPAVDSSHSVWATPSVRALPLFSGPKGQTGGIAPNLFRNLTAGPSPASHRAAKPQPSHQAAKPQGHIGRRSRNGGSLLVTGSRSHTSWGRSVRSPCRRTRHRLPSPHKSWRNTSCLKQQVQRAATSFQRSEPAR